MVLYTDIRRFYPSITTGQAVEAWESLISQRAIPQWSEALGNKLISNHRLHCSGEEHGLLTGPMFSHLIANIVLRHVDSTMSGLLPNGYFRYVDDIALVGTREKVLAAEKQLLELLGVLGMRIRDDKRFEVPAREWLRGENDFGHENRRVSWMTFLGRLKQMMVAYPETTTAMTQRLASEGFRIIPLDYSCSVRDRTFLQRLRDLSRRRWFRRKIRHATPEAVCLEAHILRSRYQGELETILSEAQGSDGYERKRQLHKLRRCASRLVYLASPGDLSRIAEALESVPEMELYAVVFTALASRDVGRVVHYGANAAHCIADVLSASNESVACCNTDWSPAARQARAIMVAYGLKVTGWPPDDPDDMDRFCAGGFSVPTSNERPFRYFQELACLHGSGMERQHDAILRRAFDTHENLLLEIEEVLQQSY